MLHSTYINFNIIDTFNCKTLGIVDTSYYNPSMTISGYTLQVLVPGYDDPVELTYYPSGVTILNSNLLGITKVNNFDDLLDLPDGMYTIKLSICPYDQFWKETSFYRTCRLECRYAQALLNLDFDTCTGCFESSKVNKLKEVKIYIEGVKANMTDCNVKKATELYQKADSILEKLLNCNCD